MTSKNTIWIIAGGVAVAAVAYYLGKQTSDQSDFSNAIDIPIGTVGGPCQNMPTFGNIIPVSATDLNNTPPSVQSYMAILKKQRDGLLARLVECCKQKSKIRPTGIR